MKIGMFPGSFDPIHEGHVSVIEKASRIFDKLLVVVTYNNEKTKQNDINSRAQVVDEKIKHLENVKVLTNPDTPTHIFANNNNVTCLVRSARNDRDFQFELELAAGNKALGNLETILILPELDKISYESRLIRQGVKK